MNKPQTELNKLRILLNAIDATEEKEAPDFIQELKEIAWSVLVENPGIKRTDWIDILIRQYPGEVIDAFGPNLHYTYNALSDLWDDNYECIALQEQMSYAQWSKYIAKAFRNFRYYPDRESEIITALRYEIHNLKRN